MNLAKGPKCKTKKYVASVLRDVVPHIDSESAREELTQYLERIEMDDFYSWPLNFHGVTDDSVPKLSDSSQRYLWQHLLYHIDSNFNEYSYDIAAGIAKFGTSRTQEILLDRILTDGYNFDDGKYVLLRSLAIHGNRYIRRSLISHTEHVLNGFFSEIQANGSVTKEQTGLIAELKSVRQIARLNCEWGPEQREKYRLPDNLEVIDKAKEEITKKEIGKKRAKHRKETISDEEARRIEKRSLNKDEEKK